MADVHIGGEWLDALERYVTGLQATTRLAGSRAAAYLQEQTVATAGQNDRWADLAEEISVWSQDGQLVVGVANDAFTSQAWALEYGEGGESPSPLFRTMTELGRRMSGVVDQTFTQTYGGSGGG